MCVGYKEVHMECNHQKAPVVFEKCEFAKGEGCTSPGGIRIIWFKELKAPSLCVDCYRHHEEDIFEMFRSKLEFHKNAFELWKQFEDDKDAMENPSIRETIHKSLEEQERGLSDTWRQRARCLADFRLSQGVWGDG